MAKPVVVYLTAGGAGMFCGSCMNDNTLARAMHGLGVEMLLVPMYTPIRTDEENVSARQIFFGGINVYLQQRVPLFRFVPSWLDRALDSPWLLQAVSKFGIQTDAHRLGALTVSMVRGTDGNQRKEVRRLVDWLAKEVRPEIVHLSNILIAGCAPEIKRRLGVPVLVTLQGDDIFLNGLAEPFRSQSLAAIRQNDRAIDGYLVHSRYYADHMSAELGIDREKMHIVPLGIDVQEFSSLPERNPRWVSDAPRIGYFARLAEEKGLHVLVDAFIELKRRPANANVELRIAGWLGPPHLEFAQRQFDKLTAAGLSDAYHYAGVVDRRQKLDFYSSIDVLSVPTVYREPKGLFVLEALAGGIPVVQPDHGAFPELLADTGGGLLTPPNDPVHLANALEKLLQNHELRHALGRTGRQAVQHRRNALSMAQRTLELYQTILNRPLIAAS